MLPRRDSALDAWRALVAFHAHGGARAALRAGTIAVTLVIFVIGSAPSPAATVLDAATALVARRPPGDVAPAQVRLLLGAFAAALGAIGAHRVTLGAAGWLRSLPVSGVIARRAAWTAVAIAALPAGVFALGAVAVVGTAAHASLAAPKVVGLPVLLAAACALVLRVERPGARGLAGAALVGAAWGTWPALAAAAALLAAWDRYAGALASLPLRATAAAIARSGQPARGAPAAVLPPRAVALTTAVRWAWRIAGWRALVNGVLAAALPIAFVAFVRANNPDLALATRASVARLGVGLGVVACVASLAAALLARRAPWPWVRTLPWSSTERVLVDAVALGLPALGVGAAGAIALAHLTPGPHPVRSDAAGVVVAAVVAIIAAPAAAAALRAGAGRQTGAVGELAVVALPGAVALALRPTFAVVTPLLALALGVLAVRRERRALDAVRWNELRHDVTGDVGWIARV